MNIRPVQRTDNVFLADMIRRVFEEHNAPKEGTVYSDSTTDDLFQLFQREKSVLWVAETKGEIIGSCGIFPTDGLPGHHAELVKFYLLKQYRGQGIGKKLMERSIASAKELGYEKIYLESLPAFSNAVQMYEKLGFLRLPKPLGVSGHTSCNIWMIKNL